MLSDGQRRPQLAVDSQVNEQLEPRRHDTLHVDPGWQVISQLRASSQAISQVVPLGQTVLHCSPAPQLFTHVPAPSQSVLQLFPPLHVTLQLPSVHETVEPSCVVTLSASGVFASSEPRSASSVVAAESGNVEPSSSAAGPASGAGSEGSSP